VATVTLPLSGVVAIVTGGARGIGQGHCEALASRGASVVVADLDADAATDVASAIGGDAVGCKCDVTDEDSVRDLVSFAVGRFGRVDALVCNAGGAKAINPRRSFFDIDRALWDSVLHLNLTSAWLCAKHSFETMKKQGSGRIVLVSSASASTALPIGISPYIAAKGGVEALTRALARECGPHGIGVNAVAPGFTPVEAVRNLHGETGTAELEREMLSRQSRPVVGTPADVAAAVAFLVSPESAHITGQVLHVDGGWVL
jgi:3-oxoacyl-[acyl-carrier protein] reductase